MIGGYNVKLHDFIALLGVIIIISTTLYIDLLIGLYVSGAFLILIGFILSRTYTPKKGGG